MMVEEKITACIDMIGAKDVPVYFDGPVIVKITPHTELYRCYGCVVTREGELKLMGAQGNWDEVKPKQVNSNYVIQSVYQRLRSIKSLQRA